MALDGLHIHFMGIGGIGVSALAEMARAAGAVVTGCDRAENAVVRRLRAKGVDVHIGHGPEHVIGTDLLVFSSAVPDEHPERLAAGERQERRGRFLARFLDERQSWGVCGTHGKTTTTWLLSHILIESGRDPAIFIGGEVADLPEGNYRLGRGPFISELDESDATFLHPRLAGALVTNIESDHLSHYGTDAALKKAFAQFAHGVADAGMLVVGVDNAASAELYARHSGRKLSYGLTEAAELRARELRSSATGNVFQVLCRGRYLGEFQLPLAGKHNVQNALAAIGAATEMGVEVECVRRALASVRSVQRRLEQLGILAGAALYSDYAHHPTEVAATIDALRERHGGQILAVFQPHLYSRTRDYADAFGAAVAKADMAVVTDIYPAREAPLPGVTAELVATAARRSNSRVSGPFSLSEAAEEASRLAGGCSAVVFMGAGDIDSAARRLAGEVAMDAINGDLA